MPRGCRLVLEPLDPCAALASPALPFAVQQPHRRLCRSQLIPIRGPCLQLPPLISDGDERGAGVCEPVHLAVLGTPAQEEAQEEAWGGVI